MNLTRTKHSGFSMVEAMVGITIFVVTALAIAGVHQKLGRDTTRVHLNEKSLEYMECEIDRLNRLIRIPERDGDGKLVYRDTNGNVVANGGSLVPYGYTNYAVAASTALNSDDQTVTYPDILDNMSTATGETEKIKLKRRYTVTIFNAGQADEYKQVTITLSDAATPARINPITQTIILKKPDPRALDTRIANGTASFTGKVLDKNTGLPPTSAVTVTLIPDDQTANRTATVDGNGNFYFAPPINPKTNYTVQIQASGYWLKTFAVTLTPGANILSVPNNPSGTVAISPYIYADAQITVLNGDTNSPLPGTVIGISHNGLVPNSGQSGYVASVPNSGVALFHIGIPYPDSTTYSNYFIVIITTPNFIAIQTPTDRFLNLNKDVPVTRSYSLYSMKKGSVKVTVNKPNGLPNPTAKAVAYLNPNYTSVAAQGTTDANGQVVLNNLPINSIGAPQQVTRTFYIQVTSPNYLIASLTSPLVVDVTATEQAQLNVTMVDHKLNWFDTVDSTAVTVGFSTTLQARATYEGYQGPNFMDIVSGPNPQPFLGGSVTSGGFSQTTFNWSGWDNSVISVQSGSRPDTQIITGLATGHTGIDVTATYSYSWSGVPYTLTATRHYDVRSVVGNVILNGTFASSPAIIPPSSSQIFTVAPSVSPADLIYTWSISGDGVSSFTPMTDLGVPTSNASDTATRCSVTTSATLLSQFTISATLSSASLGQTVTINRTCTVNYPPLTVSLSPSGTFNMQPGFNTTVKATVSGGSNQYSYAWTLINPVTGDPDTTTGSLSALSGQQTVFSALQIGSVNVNVHVVDTSSGRFVDNATIMSVQPSGGVTAEQP
jgi:hypothetical protein